MELLKRLAARVSRSIGQSAECLQGRHTYCVGCGCACHG
jgi:hypothetical protein